MTDHAIFARPMQSAPPHGYEQAMFGMGCYWGVERLFWQLPGIWMTQVGFAGGAQDAPSYEQVCAGRTGHAEVVHLIYDPGRISYDQLLTTFWDNHDPTQGNRQGNDIGDQYRSLIMTYSEAQLHKARSAMADYGNRLALAGMGPITTQIRPATPFWPAHEAHQQYLHKNPAGYCGLRGTGVKAAMPHLQDLD